LTATSIFGEVTLGATLAFAGADLLVTLALVAGLALLFAGLDLVAVLEDAAELRAFLVLAELAARETGLLRLAVFVVFLVMILQKNLKFGWGDYITNW